MKLLLTLDFPPEKGGVQRYLYEKVVHTYGPGDIVIVGARGAAPAASALPCPVSRHANILSGMNKKWSVINFVIILAFKLPRNPDTIIECGNVYAALAPWLLSFFRPLRYRIYTYGGEMRCLRQKKIKAWLFKRVLRRADTLFAIGNYVTRLLRDAEIVNEIQLDPPRIVLKKEGRPPKQADDRTLRLLSVGRLVPHKGHAVLLEAVSLLPPGLDWQLVLAGSGPEEDRLKRIIAGKKISPRVTLKEGLDDAALEGEYLKADIFILPSIETAGNAEGFGIVLLEAAAHGVPVIASRVGGVPEVLDDGRCGVLVDPGNPEAFCAAIHSLFLDAGKRKQLSTRALERVREHYAW